MPSHNSYYLQTHTVPLETVNRPQLAERGQQIQVETSQLAQDEIGWQQASQTRRKKEEEEEEEKEEEEEEKEEEEKEEEGKEEEKLGII